MNRRAVHIASGIAVLFTSLAYAHIVHHFFFVHPHQMSPGYVAGLIAAVGAGILSFIGAYLLLTGGRRQA
jgi:hypothetical protein